MIDPRDGVASATQTGSLCRRPSRAWFVSTVRASIAGFDRRFDRLHGGEDQILAPGAGRDLEPSAPAHPEQQIHERLAAKGHLEPGDARIPAVGPSTRRDPAKPSAPRIPWKRSRAWPTSGGEKGSTAAARAPSAAAASVTAHRTAGATAKGPSSW